MYESQCRAEAGGSGDARLRPSVTVYMDENWSTNLTGVGPLDASRISLAVTGRQANPNATQILERLSPVTATHHDAEPARCAGCRKIQVCGIPVSS